MKSILFITASLGLGGSERCMVEMIKNMDRTRYKITVQALFPVDVLPDLPKDIEIMNGYIGFDLCSMPMSQFVPLALKSGKLGMLISRSLCWGSQKLSNKHASTYFWKYLRKFVPNLNHKFDAVIGYGQGFATYFAMDKVPNVKRKILWLNTDLEKARYDIDFIKRFYTNADAVFTDSNNNVNILRRLYPEIGDTLYYFPNMMDNEMIRKKANEYEPNYLVSSDMKILTVGRFAEAKALHLAIEAAGIMKQQGYNFKWYFVGDGDTRKSLENQIETLSLNDSVVLCGSMTNPYPWFAKCDLYVQTSIYEGSCMTINEAMQFYKPIVCTNFPSAYEKIVHGKNGLLAEMNGKDIAKKIIYLLDHPEQLKNIQNYQREYPLLYDDAMNALYAEIG